MNQADVPSPINLKKMSDAKDWESNAMQRPFRIEFFEAFRKELIDLNLSQINVLELGSGPGFLAEYLLSSLPQITMSLLDNSLAMHELAKKRLGDCANRVQFIEQDFKVENWYSSLESFDAVITLQAVHELRHKRHAQSFHEQVKPLLSKDGVYLFCDHYYGEGGMEDNQLYMSISEQKLSLKMAGYQFVEVLNKGGRVLYRAT